jgi:hypothetical protein
MVTVKSVEVTAAEAGTMLTTRQKHGRLRVATFSYTAPAAHADGSDVELVTLPANRVTVLGVQSTLKVSALGGSRVGKVGYKAYTKLDGTTQIADDDALAVGLDLSSASTNTISNAIATADTKLSLDNKGGITLMLTVTGGTIPSGATIKGEVIYVVD